MELLKNAGAFVLGKLKDKKTWLYLLGALAAVGVTVSTEMQDLIANVGVAATELAIEVLDTPVEPVVEE